MRRILVEAARREPASSAAGTAAGWTLRRPAPSPDERLLALDGELQRLAGEDPVAARVVELRHFTGLGHEQVAAVLGITVYQGAAEMGLRPGLAARCRGRMNLEKRFDSFGQERRSGRVSPRGRTEPWPSIRSMFRRCSWRPRDRLNARAAVLDRECGADSELRRRVAALLDAHDASGNFLDEARRRAGSPGPRRRRTTP